MLKMKDSSGRPSNTLGFATIAFIVGTAAFIYKLPTDTPFSLFDYGSFIGTAIAPFVAREWIKS